MEKNAARSAHAPLKNGAAVRGSRLKIATDVAGMLGVIRSPSKNGAVRSHWREWRLTALHAGTDSPRSPSIEFEPAPKNSRAPVTEQVKSSLEIPETLEVALEKIQREEDSHNEDGNTPYLYECGTVNCPDRGRSKICSSLAVIPSGLPNLGRLA
jgi:hypothetical protein